MNSYGIIQKVLDVGAKDLVIPNRHMFEFWIKFENFQRSVEQEGKQVRAEQTAHTDTICVVRIYCSDINVIKRLLLCLRYERKQKF